MTRQYETGCHEDRDERPAAQDQGAREDQSRVGAGEPTEGAAKAHGVGQPSRELRVQQYIRLEYQAVSEVLVHIDPEPDQLTGAGGGLVGEEEHLSRPREAIERDIREVVTQVAGVSEVTHILLHFLSANLSIKF